MATFTTTPEEKATHSYLDWDDASLGRFAKHIALTLERLADDAEGLKKVTAFSCAMMLVGTCVDSNAATLEMKLSDHTHSGVPTGDWIVTVRKLPKKRRRYDHDGHTSASNPPPDGTGR